MDNEKNTSSVGTKMNKNSLIMLIRVVALSLLFVLAISFAVACNKKGGDSTSDSTSNSSSESTQITEGAETGVYYYANGDEEYLVTLNSGDKFTLLMDNINKSGTYTITGETLNFTFNKSADGTMNGTLSGNTIILLYNNVEMRFMKKVDYTVNFDSKGGTTVAPITVMNGKTVDFPVAPTLDGYIFAGWCVDENCENFATSSTIITENTTFYAKWVEHRPGESEYIITFKYNDGVTADATETTVGGQLFGVETPSNNDSIFTGWWISDYEDGSKLSYKYTDGMVFDENTTLYAGWYKKTGSALEAPAVSVAYNNISWESVADAINYSVSIEGPAGFESFENELTTTTNRAVDFANAPAGEYVIKVTANASSEANSATTTRYFKNKALARVSYFNVIDPATVVFAPVANATQYSITVTCGTQGHNHKDYNLGNATYFNFSGCDMAKEGMTFTVTATAKGYAPSVSNAFVYIKNLDKAELYFDEATQTVVWDKVQNAIGYVVTATCGDTIVLDNVNIGNVNSYSFKGYAAGEITFSVTPVTKGFNSPEPATMTFTKENLAAPNGFKVKDTVISWDAVEGADSYDVKIGEQVVATAVTGTSCDLVNSYDWEDGKEYQVYVKANGAKESLWSDAFDMRYYAMDYTLNYSEGIVSWGAVFGAVKYEVSVNGNITTVADGDNFCDVNLTSRENVISVRFVDNNNMASNWATIEVEAFVVEFDTRGGTSVGNRYYTMGDKFGTLPTPTKSGFEFGGWYSVAGGASAAGEKYDEYSVFTAGCDIILYASWDAVTVTANYNLGDNGTWGDGVAAPVSSITYMSRNYTLGVPSPIDTSYVFAGWYTAANGNGIRMTDDYGTGLEPWNFASDESAKVYAYFVKVFKFKLLSDGTYSVSRDADINLVSRVKIPATYGEPGREREVSTVEAYAFQKRKNLKEVLIPDTISLVEYTTAFTDCTGLEAINVYKAKDGNYEVKYSSSDGVLFWNNDKTGMREIVFVPTAKGGEFAIPYGVEAIPYKAFANTKLTKVTIPSSVWQINEGAFTNCSSLTEVVFESAKAGESSASLVVDAGAFSNCSALISISLPARTAELAIDSETKEMTIFEGCNSLREINMEEGNANYASNDGVLTDIAGSTIIYCPVARRGVYTVPAKVTTINEYAFSNCFNLTGVVIHNNVTKIGDYAFNGCTNILFVEFKGRAMQALEIGDYAFAGNTDLRTLTFEKDSMVSTIGDYAFYGCTSLQDVEIPASLRNVGKYAFADCSALATISFANESKTVDFAEGVFANCKSITKVNLPASIDKLPLGAFEGCKNIVGIYVDDASPYFYDDNGVVYSKDGKELYYYPLLNGNVTLPDAVEVINAGVFKGNTNITKFTFGANIKEIGASAFENCILLSEIDFSAITGDVTIGEYAFANCVRIESFTAPDSLTAISDGMFSGNTMLSNVSLNENITYIGNYAFNRTAVAFSTLPAALETIGDYAFASTRMTNVTLSDKIKSIGAYSFNGCANLVVFNTGDAPLEAIPEGAFKGTAITTITIPNTVAYIGLNAFENITTLTEVIFEEGNDELDLVIGEKVEYKQGHNYGTWGSHAFNGCSSLTSVNIPKRLTIVGENAFAFADINGELDFTETKLQHVGAHAFMRNVNVEAILLPNTLNDVDANTTAIEYSAFDSCESAYYTIATGGAGTITLEDRAFQNVYPGDLYLPKNVVLKLIPGFSLAIQINWYLGYFDSIEVEGGSNGQFMIEDNIFYNLEGNEIIYVPSYVSSLTVSTRVTSIGKEAAKQSGLKTLIFEEGDESTGTVVIGEDAFAGKKLNTLTLSNRVEVIGARAFSGCFTQTTATAPHSVTIPASVTSIEQYAFTGCTTLTEIVFEENSKLERIGNYAFQNAGTNATYRLTSIELPSSLKSLGEYAFTKCKYLTTVDFGENSQLTTMGQRAFYESGLTTISLPGNLKNIGKNAFGNTLTSVKLGDETNDLAAVFSWFSTSVTGTATGGGNTVLKNIIVPETSKHLKNGTKIVDGEEVPDTTVVYSKDGKELVALAPATTGTDFTVAEGTTVIRSSAFQNSKFTGAISLPSTLAEIQPHAFMASKFTSLTIAAGNTPLVIGDYAFYQAKIAGTVTIPARVSQIGNFAFYSVENVTSYVFETQGSILRSIGDSAFSGPYDVSNSKFTENTQLTSIRLPASLESIGKQAFAGCAALETLEFEDGCVITAISPKAFYWCTSLIEVELPAYVDAIEKEAFAACTALETVTFPDSLSTIGEYAFAQTSITSVNIPGSVGYISDYAFAGCASLEEVILNDGTEAIGNCAFAGDAVYSVPGLTKVYYGKPIFESITLPDTIIAVGDYAFSNNEYLTNVTLSNSLTALGAGVFEGCTAIEEISIPASVLEIGDRAFYNASSLASVEIFEGLQSIGASAFYGTALEEFKIPASLKELGFNPFGGNENFSGFEIADGNNFFAMENGVLYNHEKTVLIVFPVNFTGEYVMPSTLTELVSGAFSGSYVTSVVIGTGITEIPEGAFNGATELQRVVFHEGITYIKDSAFEDCENLTEIASLENGEVKETYLPSGLLAIGKAAFKNTGIEAVHFGALIRDVQESYVADDGYTVYTVVSGIGESAFSNASNLTTVTFDNNGREPLSIGKYAFEYTNIENITFPFRLRSKQQGTSDTVIDGIGQYAFRNTKNLNTVNFEENGDASMISTPVSMGQYAFAESGIKTINFPAHLGSVMCYWYDGDMWDLSVGGTFGAYTFKNCTNLTTITFKDSSVYEISAWASGVFQGCTALKEFTFPSNLRTIGNTSGFFKDCTGLETVTLVAGNSGDGGLTIPSRMFEGCTNIKTINFLPNKSGKNITSIGSYAFANSGLVNFTVPESITSIGSYAFQNCGSLTNINLPSKLTTIGSYAFQNCTKLTEIVIPANVNKVNTYMFAGCTSLRKVTIPAKVTALANYIFQNCSKLELIEYGGTTSAWKTAYKNKTGWNSGTGAFNVKCSDGWLNKSGTAIEDPTQN